jgi:FkbM family methyltransferase
MSDVVTTPFGKFLVDDRDIIESTTRAGTLWDGPGFLQPIAMEYGRLGEPGVTILDVGANVGTFSIWLASKGAWRVVAVEPVPSTMARLKANLDLNREMTASRVIPVQVAAYDKSCWMALAAPIDPGNVGGTALVPNPIAVDGILGERLDVVLAYLWSNVSLIKIDAQGCDGAAIVGLRDTIKKYHPAIVFEWEADLAAQHRYTLDDIIERLGLLQYEVHEWPTHPNNYLAVWRPR